MKYKLAIFDMDGTILDTLSDLHICTNHSLRKCGYPERSYDEVRKFVGNGIHRLVERAVPEGTDKEETERVFNTFNDYYAMHCADNTTPYTGIVDLIKRLRDKGVRTAVVSNKSDYAVQELCVEYFDGLFDYAVGVKDGIEKKPAPDAVYYAMEKCEATRENSVYIGDSEVDIKTAHNAGIPCITVLWGFRTYDEVMAAGATITVESVDELEALL